MRILIKALLLLAPLGASGQGSWSLEVPIGERGQAMDVVELPNGNWLSIITSGYLYSGSVTKARSWTALISPLGAVLQIDPLEEGGKSIHANCIVPGTNNHPFHMLGSTWDSLLYTQHGVLQVRIDQEGGETGRSIHLLGDGNFELTFSNATLDQAGGLFITGGAYINMVGPYHVPDKIFLMRLGQAGEEFGQAILGTNGLSLARHAIRSNDSLMLVSMQGGTGVGPWGLYKFLHFNAELEYVDGFPGTSVSGSGNINPPDSSMQDDLYMTALSQGSFLVSARYGYASQRIGAVLGRIGPDGSQEAMFLPHSEEQKDFCAAYQGHDMMPNGNIVFSVLEGFDWNWDGYSSDHTSRIHLYLLDTLLNVICDQIAVEGADDGFYYFVNRVKATSDGGTLLMGTKMDVGAMSAPVPWIMKLAPWDCHIGIEERSPITGAIIYPNPGRESFMVCVNGPTVPSGSVILFDAQGRTVGSASLIQSRATVHAEALSPGIYLYRITDDMGQLKATGRWVKE